MARYLMTHSLLSSWLYAMKENPFEDMTSERDSFAEFMATLRREHSVPNEAMLNGIAFEDLVTAITQDAAAPTDRWYEPAAEIARRVQGGVSQYKARRELQFGSMGIILYGRLDWLKAGEIIDIKFSKSYDVGKYFDSTQHPTYFELVPEAKTFTYLVSNGSAVWSETYRRDETRSIRPTISEFLDWLDAMDLMDLYRVHWLAK